MRIKRIAIVIISVLMLISLISVFQAKIVSAQEIFEVGEGKEYTTIQEAINDASHNAMILVYSGTYIWTRNIVINKSLTIKSVDGYEETIIDCTTLKGNYIISINHSNFTLDGFTIMGKGIIRIKGQKEKVIQSVNILNNLIVGISGIDLESRYGAIIGITIARNTIENCNYGIRVKAMTAQGEIAKPIENVNIENNNLLNCKWFRSKIVVLPSPVAATVNATFNWWESTVESEIAMMVNGDVAFTPYLNAPYGYTPEGNDEPPKEIHPLMIFLFIVFALWIISVMLNQIRKGEIIEGVIAWGIVIIVVAIIFGIVMSI